jgi:AcrR family transcriptional regulator
VSAAPSAHGGKPVVGSTHERFLRIGKTLFASRGYEHTSTSAIAREAGTSESQLMKHFGSKAGLLEAIFNEGWIQITAAARAAIETVSSPREKLRVIAGSVVRCWELDPEMKLLILMEGYRIRKGGYIVSITEGFLGFVRLVDGCLNEMQEAHMLRPGLHPQAIRSALFGMMEGMMRDRFFAKRVGFPADFDVAQAREIQSVAMDSYTLDR